MTVTGRGKIRNIGRGFGNLRSGELVICEQIVRTTDAHLEYNANQKVQTFYAIKRGPYTCLCIRNTEITFITIQNAERNRLSVHVTKIPQNVSVAAAVICTILGLPSTYMPSQRINTAQTETHSKILPSLGNNEKQYRSKPIQCPKHM